MANSREAVLALNPGRIVGGPHDLVCPINRQDLPDEMFDPRSTNRAYGPDVRFFDDEGNELARDYIVNSFVLDSASGSGDGRVEYWLRLQQVSASAQTVQFIVQYGDPALGNYPVDGEFGRFVTWMDAEFAIVGSANIDRSGNSSWSVVGFPSVEYGGPFGSYRRFIGSDRYLSFSPNVGGRLRTANWTLSTVSLREKYGYSLAAAGFSGTQPVRIYPLDADAGNGARLTWGTQISGTELSVAKTGTGGLWQWVDVAVTSSSQRLRINGDELEDDEILAISDPGSFSGGLWGIGGAPELPENWGGSIAAVILWKSSQSDDWMVSNYALAQAGAWTPGEPGPVGGDPVLHQEVICIDFITASLLSEQLRMRTVFSVAFLAQSAEGEVLRVQEQTGLGIKQGVGFQGVACFKDSLALGEVFNLRPDGRSYIAQDLGLNFNAAFSGTAHLRFHDALALNVAADLEENAKRSLAFDVKQNIEAQTTVSERAQVVVSCALNFGSAVDISAAFYSHLDGLAPPNPLVGGPRYYDILPTLLLSAFEAESHLSGCDLQDRDLRPQGDNRADDLVQRSRILIPEFDLRKTRSGE
ncbi:MAG: hypothetical protein PVF65_09785 [Sphingomonadales bacterium]|jgi:hypothetical protein